MRARDVMFWVCAEMVPGMIEKIKILVLAMRKSGFSFYEESKRRLVRKTLFGYLVQKFLVFIFCFFVVQKISDVILSLGNISPLLALAISWYVDKKVVPDVLRDIGFEL